MVAVTSIENVSIPNLHYDDVIMGAIAFQITSFTTVYSGADESKHQSSASLAFVWGIHRGPVNSLHKWPVTRKMLNELVSVLVCGRVNECMPVCMILSVFQWVSVCITGVNVLQWVCVSVWESEQVSISEWVSVHVSECGWFSVCYHVG